MGALCSRRSLAVRLYISIEPEEESVPKPATEAQGVPEPREASGEDDLEDTASSASWDLVAEPLPPIEVQLQQRRGYRANADAQASRTLQVQLRPVLQVPFPCQLVHI